MVATTRCSQIQHDQLEALVGDGLWEQLLEEAGKKLHLNFGFRMSSLVDSCITGLARPHENRKNASVLDMTKTRCISTLTFELKNVKSLSKRFDFGIWFRLIEGF